jgi:hypothetical protein
LVLEISTILRIKVAKAIAAVMIATIRIAVLVVRLITSLGRPYCRISAPPAAAIKAGK